MRIALAVNYGDMVAAHFGRCSAFIIADINDKNYEWRIVERRENNPACDRGGHDAAAFSESLKLIEGCKALIAMKVGHFAKDELSRRNIAVYERGGIAADLLDAYAGHMKEACRPKVVDIRSHPCFFDGKGARKARLHLPVSAACNIQCRFCIRSMSRLRKSADPAKPPEPTASNGLAELNELAAPDGLAELNRLAKPNELAAPGGLAAPDEPENRPGVSAGILSPQDAVETVRRALELCGDIAVVGIAGPGDALASPHAMETFRLVHDAYPDLINCASTNGLALPGKAQQLLDAGVRTLTVTVNAVDPQITAQIVSRISVDGKSLSGAEAGAILIRNQLAGIREAAAAGITVKVNTVLIPGINDGHIADIARAASEAGATRHNIIPLIPQYEFADTPAPTCLQIEKARAEAGRHIQQFLHCAHCRADACGVPGGDDVSGELYENRAMETFSHG